MRNTVSSPRSLMYVRMSPAIAIIHSRWAHPHPRHHPQQGSRWTVTWHIEGSRACVVVFACKVVDLVCVGKPRLRTIGSSKCKFQKKQVVNKPCLPLPREPSLVGSFSWHWCSNITVTPFGTCIWRIQLCDKMDQTPRRMLLTGVSSRISSSSD